MTKKLPTDMITNELTGSSVFFQQPSPSKPSSGVSEQDKKPNPPTQTADVIQPVDLPGNQSNNRDSVLSRHHAVTHTGNQPRTQDDMADDRIEGNLDEIRKAVKQLGKELSTHRFTPEEKAVLSDIVYTYARQGVRTSENEITRIGVNWLLVDYRQNGTNSVLARLLERLHG